MEFGQLEQILGSEATYGVVAGVGAITGFIGGYFLGKVFSRKRALYRQMEHNERISSFELKKKEAEVALEREKNSIELRNMEYEESARVYEREQRALEARRVYDKEMEQEKHKRGLELSESEMKKIEARKAYVGEAVSKIRPALEEYLQRAISLSGGDYEKEREEHRRQLVDEYIQEQRDDGDIYDTENNVADKDVKRRINDLVNLRFPRKSEQIPVPEELRSFMNYLVDKSDSLGVGVDVLRERYRRGLIDRYLEDVDDELLDTSYDIPDEEVMARIGSLVNLRYPWKET